MMSRVIELANVSTYREERGTKDGGDKGLFNGDICENGPPMLARGSGVPTF